jgi:hypothetical protein
MSESEEDESKGIPILDEKNLRELAMGICDGKIFHDRMIDPRRFQQDVGMVFMPLALGGLEGIEPKTIGLMYEYYDQAGPRSVNGMPCFFSFRILHRDNIEDLQKYIEEIEYFKSKFMGDKEKEKELVNKSFEDGLNKGSQDEKTI